MIGVFDSGVGGLTVLAAMMARIPSADYLYFGDTARLPYGSKSAATVAHYAVGAMRYLQDRGAELLVIACNTATALAFDEIKAASSVPVIGVVEPGAEAAATASKNKHVVVIGTEATVASHAYRRALESRGIAVHEKACPLFVPLVEEGWLEHPVTGQVAQIYLAEAFGDDGATEATNEGRHADTLVLGCTHYPLLKPMLRRIAPAHISIVDSAESTAQHVARQLGLAAESNTEPRSGRQESAPEASARFFATDSPEKFRASGSRFLGRNLAEVIRVDLKE